MTYKLKFESLCGWMLMLYYFQASDEKEHILEFIIKFEFNNEACLTVS